LALTRRVDANAVEHHAATLLEALRHSAVRARGVAFLLALTADAAAANMPDVAVGDLEARAVVLTD
jgi:hypothetical protein